MVGWSGSGRFEDLERTVGGKLSPRVGDVERIDDTLLVDSDDPVEVARRLSLLPGVAWIAVGFRFKGGDGYLKNLGLLAKRYLSKGKTFKISAIVTRSKKSAGDAVLAGNSELLSLIPGAKVDARGEVPRVLRGGQRRLRRRDPKRPWGGSVWERLGLVPRLRRGAQLLHGLDGGALGVLSEACPLCYR